MPDITEVFLYLTGCALNGITPDEAILADIDWAKLRALAKKHSLVSAVGYAVEKTAAFEQASPEIRKAWREAKEKAVRKTLMLDTERAALFAEFEKHGIWYVPLKGIVTKGYYPRFGMREMCDNDILFDQKKRAEVRQIFESRGYTVKDYCTTHHDTYEKAPLMNFEMHIMLINSYRYPRLAAYYDHVQERLIKDDGNAFGYHFSDEDLYIYTIAHAYKHYCNGEIGVRALADLYILNQRLGQTLDRSAVDRVLSSLELLDYERKTRALAESLFAHPALLSESGFSSSEREELACYLYTTHRTATEQAVKRVMSNAGYTEDRITLRAKARYLTQRLFPGRELCRIGYPVVYRHPILLPFFWVWRILFKATKRIPALKREFKALKKSK